MTNTPRALAFYFRVSTDAQEFPMQEHALKEYCRRQAPSWPVPGKGLLFREKISGKTSKRTQLDLLREACRQGRVDTVLTYALNRIGSNPQHLVNLLAEWDGLKIRVVGVSDGFDSTANTPGSTMYRHMLIGFAASTREQIVQRIKAGVAASKARGDKWGRPRINDAKIARAWELKGQTKLSLRDIAKQVELSPGYLSGVFNGRLPSPGMLNHLANVKPKRKK